MDWPSHSSDIHVGTLVAAVPGVMASVLGLVGTVSEHRD